MKRVFSILLAVILVTLLSVPAFAVQNSGTREDPSEYAEAFNVVRSNVIKIRSYPYGTSFMSRSGTNGWYYQYLVSSSLGEYEILPFYTLPSAIEEGHTYYINFSVYLYGTSTDASTKGLDFNTNAMSGLSYTYGSDFDLETTNYATINSGTPLSELFDRFSYFIQNVPMTPDVTHSTVNIQFVCHANRDIPLSEFTYFCPRLYFYGDTSKRLLYVAEVNGAQSWKDPDELTFEQLTGIGIQNILTSIDEHTDYTVEQIESARQMLSQDIDELNESIESAASQAHTDAQALQNKIDSAADQAHEDQEALQGLISGDPDDAVDSSSLSDDLSDLDDVESDIYDRLDLTVNLGDEEVVIDADIFSKIDEYLDGIEAARFDTDVGSQFNKIWDLIFGYLAIPIILTLTLGSALAFLKGRSKA